MREAAVMLIIKGGKILSISRRNDPTKFGLLGGKVDFNETTKQAAIRETFEESGVIVNECELIYTRVEPKIIDDGEDFNTACFYAINWDDSEIKSSSEEGIVKWLSVSELTSTVSGAFPHYNIEAFAAFNKKFPDNQLV